MATATNSSLSASARLGWGVLRSIRRTFFSDWRNGTLTVVSAFVIYHAVTSLVSWAVLDATFVGQSRADCNPLGACWPFVTVHARQFAYGHFPLTERWRVNLAFVLLIVTLLPMMPPKVRRRRIVWLGPIVIFPCAAGVLLIGGPFGLAKVPSDDWGGLMLTLTLFYSATLGALPLGVFLALGRRSRLPFVRTVSIAVIEFFRGVPLVTILFTSLFMLPIVLPEGMSLDKLARAAVALMIFYGAYIAEVVRGGLQALPHSQYEAAKALGLGYWRAHALVILPQALRLVIPGIMNVTIGLLKDSTLVTIIGLFDLLGIARQALGDPEWVGLSSEAYLFVSVVFFLMCYAMSILSHRLERRIKSERMGY